MALDNHRLLFLFLTCIAFAMSTHAQFGQVVKGDEYSTARKENFNGFIGENQTTLFTVDYLYISRKKQELILRKFYKTDLSLVDSKNIYEIPPDGFYGEPIEVYYHNDSVFLFNNLYDEVAKTLYITLEIYNINYEKLTSFTVDTLPDDETMHIRESAEKNGFILLKSKKFSNLTEQEIDAKIINHAGELFLNETLKSPLALQTLNIEEIEFTLNGLLYILCNYNFDPANSGIQDERTVIANKYAIWSYDIESKFMKEIELRMKGKWINGVKMRLNKNHQLILSGYFNESKNNTVNGVFSVLINEDLSIAKSSYEKFSDEVLFKFIDEKDRLKIKELEDYTLNDMVMLKNDFYFLLGERFYKYVERTYDPRTNITTTTEHYNYNSIIVSLFDSLGNELWTDRIPKYQNSTNDYGYFSSFATISTGSKLFLFFNDTDKNNELALNDYFNYKSLYNNRRFQVTGVEIDTSGIISRKQILGTDNPFMLRAKVSNQVCDSVMYMFTEVGRSAKVFAVGVE